MKDIKKQLFTWTVLGAVVMALYTFVPPMLKAGAQVFTLGVTYQTMNKQIADNTNRLKVHDQQIEDRGTEMREFRSVWCLDRLSSHAKVNPSVLETCAAWIKKP